MVGDVGGAILFFISMIGMIIVGLYTLAYAAHIVLAVIECTASGTGQIAWPNEPYVDWLWKFFYLLWLVSVWLVPLGFISQWLHATRSEAAALPGVIAAATVLFWLLFPMSLMSSLSASSRWVLFTPSLLPRLAQRGGSVLVYYVLTAPVLGLGAVAVYALVFVGALWMTIVAAVVLSAVLLIYSRLFGRLVLQLRFTNDRPERSRAPKRKPMTQTQAADRVARLGPRADLIHANDLPPINAPDEEARIGYDLRIGNDALPEPTATPRRRPIDQAEGQYDLADEPIPEQPLEPRLPARLLNPTDYELRLAGRGRTIRPPDHPWLSGVWGFPFAAGNRFPFVGMAIGFAVVGTLYRLMASYTPG